MHFRRHSDHVGKHLHKNVIESMSIKVLTLLRVRRYARKARAYRRAYELNDEGAIGKDDIEMHNTKLLQLFLQVLDLRCTQTQVGSSIGNQ